ncbi:MAG: hypothetical protein HYV07_27365 [Deltaproteobacteria bacterium]|nr:hypothetical protein [Deltaproteobacteria bacterium]
MQSVLSLDAETARAVEEQRLIAYVPLPSTPGFSELAFLNLRLIQSVPRKSLERRVAALTPAAVTRVFASLLRFTMFRDFSDLEILKNLEITKK